MPHLHDDTPQPACPDTLLLAHSDTATRSGSPLRRLSAHARGKRPRAPAPEDVINLSTLDSPPQLKKTRETRPRGCNTTVYIAVKKLRIIIEVLSLYQSKDRTTW